MIFLSFPNFTQRWCITLEIIIVLKILKINNAFNKWKKMLSQQTEKGRRSSMLCRLQQSPFSRCWVGFDIPYLPVADSFPSLLNPHSSAHLNRWLCRAPVAFCSYSPCLPGIILACSRKAREALEAKAEVMNITAALVQCKVQRTSHLSLETTWDLSIPTELIVFAFSALTALV